MGRDPDDDVVIETVIRGGATHLVSRDDDLTRDLNVIQYCATYGIQVTTVNQFLSALKIQ